jgi:hypothetical protein
VRSDAEDANPRVLAVRTNSAPRSELATLFAAAIRRLLEREALTSPNSPELSASRLDVRPQTRSMVGTF